MAAARSDTATNRCCRAPNAAPPISSLHVTTDSQDGWAHGRYLPSAFLATSMLPYSIFESALRSWEPRGHDARKEKDDSRGTASTRPLVAWSRLPSTPDGLLDASVNGTEQTARGNYREVWTAGSGGQMTAIRSTTLGCPTCESREIRPVFQSPDRDWGSGESFWFVRCARCGLVRIEPQPTPEELSRFYPEGNWPRAQSGTNALDAWILGVPWRQLMRHRAEAVRAVVPGPARLLEIGAGDGYFLRYMKELGWEVEGVEMGQPAAEFANAKLGVDVHCGRIESVSLSRTDYDVIYMHHVFEHLGSPLETLRHLRSLAEGATGQGRLHSQANEDLQPRGNDADRLHRKHALCAHGRKDPHGGTSSTWGQTCLRAPQRPAALRPRVEAAPAASGEGLLVAGA